MNRRSSLSALRWVSLLLISLAGILVTLQLVRFSRIRNHYPPGQVIAGVPVGGLDRQRAAERIIQTYAVPIELRYNEASIQIKPSVIGFELDLESMLSAADLQRTNESFWTAFWDYLWNRETNPSSVPLLADFSEDRLRIFLQEEISSRYDRPPSPAIPVPGSIVFQQGLPGTSLDINRAVGLVDSAIRSPSSRTVNLSIQQTGSPRPSLENLHILVQQIIDLNHYSGLIELYVQDLQTSELMHFAYNENTEIDPGVSFTAASTIKIPVMASVFRHLDSTSDPEAIDLVKRMIEESDNVATDQVAQQMIDPNLAPLRVTEDIQVLGLENTFWGGHFYPGAPLLKSFDTPANQRQDITTDPDVYSQTTPGDIGMLLEDIYQCAQTGGGTLVAAFPGEIDRAECQQMVSFLLNNHIGLLLQAGLPDGTPFAHKHGWLQDFSDGLSHNIADAGIVYSPGGNYVIAAYLYHPTELIFNAANQMLAQISLAVYNYYNYSAQ
jgi:beta-lactamase class A